MPDTVIDRLVTELGFRYDKRGLRQFEARLKSVRSGLNSVSRTAGRVGIAMAGSAAGALLEFGSFEKEMAKIEGLVGVSRDQLDAWGGDLKAIAAETGAAPRQLAESLFFITSAGLRGSDAIDVLRSSAKGAAAGLGDQATIADLATSAMNAYGPATLSAEDAVNALTEAVRLGKLEPPELAGAMGRVLPVASAMGVSFQEVAGLMAAMSKTGTSAEEAVTQLNAVMSGLLKPSVGAEKAFESMGMSVEEVRKMLAERGLFETLIHLREALGGNNQAFAQIFPNVRALRGIFDLMGPQLDSNRQLIDDMADSTGVLDEAFGAQTETVAFKFKQAMATIQGASIEVGAALAPLATLVADWAKQIATWSESIDWKAAGEQAVGVFNQIKDTIGAVVEVIVATAGPLIGVLEAIGLSTSHAAAAWILAIPAVLALFAAAKTLSIAITVVLGVTKAVTVATALWGAAALGTRLGLAALTVAQWAQTAATGVGVAAIRAQAAATALWGKAAISTRLGLVGLTVATWAQTAASGVAAVAVKAAAAAQWLLNAAVAAFPVLLIVAAIVAAIAAIWYFRDEIVGFLSAVWDKLTSAFAAIRDWFADNWRTLLTVMFPVAALAQMLGRYREQMLNAGRMLVTALADGITDAASAVWNAITGAASHVWDFLTGLVGAWFDAGRMLVTALADGITDAAKAPYEAAKKALGFVRNLLPFSDAREGPLSSLTESGRRLGATLARGVNASGGDLASAVGGLLPDPGSLLAPLPVGPVPTGASSSTSTRSYTLNVGDINVDAAGGDATEIASDLRSQLETQFRRLVEDADNDIEA